MITLQRNQQKMSYALKLKDKIPVYVRDDQWDVRLQVVDGDIVKMETGDYVDGYTKPVSFSAGIKNKLDEVLAKEFGIDDSTNYAQITSTKGYLPFKVGSLIWKSSEIVYTDKEETNPEPTSADYTVVGVADEDLNFDRFLLRKNVK